MQSILGSRSFMTYVMIVLAVLARFIPHIPNFSPVYGVLLFGGAHLSKRESIWFPLVLLGASDYVLNRFVYHMSIGWMELIQLAAFAVIAVVGWTLRRRVTIPGFTLAFLAGPTAFYLISNFGVWLGWHAYPRSWEGLIACYVAAIPFYGYSLASTFLFGGALFGTYEFLVVRYGQRQPAEALTH
jgi:Family of unknown function (DUF6580)